MVQINTDNTLPYCEPSLVISAAPMFSFAYLAAGLVFIAYCGIGLFGYDTLALPFTFIVPKKKLTCIVQGHRRRRCHPGPLHDEVRPQTS